MAYIVEASKHTGRIGHRARPLGIVCGRLAWRAFAGSLGVVPIVEVPVAALVLGLAGLVLAGNLLAALPAAVAARSRPGVSLQTA